MASAPALPATRAYGRSLGDFDDPAAGRSLTAAERALLAACARGETAALNDPRSDDERVKTPTPRPTSKDDSTTVRAEFIRFLALGGDDRAPVHEAGVLLTGAFVTGKLDLTGATLDRILAINSSIIEEPVKLGFATTRIVDFTRCALRQGMTAEGLRCAGSLWLREVDVDGSVVLTSASIDGYFLGEGAVIRSAGATDWALTLEGAHIGRTLRLSRAFDGSLRAASLTGGVNLTGATIDGDLACDEASFPGVAAAYALLAQRTTVGGTFSFKGIKAITGIVNLSAMTVGFLDDDLADGSWAYAGGRLLLDGFTYGRLATGAATDADQRRAWLDCQPDSATVFRPQPWDQLIAVLRASGHPVDATRLAIMQETAYRRAGKVKGLARFFHWLHGVSVAYGYRPLRLAGWLAGLWVVAALLFAAVAPGELLRPVAGAIDPNCLAARVIARGAGPCPPPARVFSPWRYSADLLIPGLRLGDADEWRLNLPDGWPRTPREVVAAPAALGLVVWLERLVGGAGFSVLALTVGSYLLKKRE